MPNRKRLPNCYFVGPTGGVARTRLVVVAMPAATRRSVLSLHHSLPGATTGQVHHRVWGPVESGTLSSGLQPPFTLVSSVKGLDL